MSVAQLKAIFSSRSATEKVGFNVRSATESNLQ